MYDERAAITCLYVGQGRCDFDDNGEGHYALFDVGPLHSGRSLIRKLRRRELVI